jgi:hypothetical protein
MNRGLLLITQSTKKLSNNYYYWSPGDQTYINIGRRNSTPDSLETRLQQERRSFETLFLQENHNPDHLNMAAASFLIPSLSGWSSKPARIKTAPR